MNIILCKSSNEVENISQKQQQSAAANLLTNDSCSNSHRMISAMAGAFLTSISSKIHIVIITNEVTPFDVVKTRLQSGISRQSSTSSDGAWVRLVFLI
jgi:hypothetical protein